MAKLKVGDKVMVRNSSSNGRRFDEGTATIREVNDTEGHYQVEFDDEPGQTYPRFVSDDQLNQE